MRKDFISLPGLWRKPVGGWVRQPGGADQLSWAEKWSFKGSRYAEPRGQLPGFKFEYFPPVISRITGNFLKFYFTNEESETELGQRWVELERRQIQDLDDLSRSPPLSTHDKAHAPFLYRVSHWESCSRYAVCEGHFSCSLTCVLAPN